MGGSNGVRGGACPAGEQAGPSSGGGGRRQCGVQLRPGEQELLFQGRGHLGGQAAQFRRGGGGGARLTDAAPGIPGAHGRPRRPQGRGQYLGGLLRVDAEEAQLLVAEAGPREGLVVAEAGFALQGRGQGGPDRGVARGGCAPGRPRGRGQ